MTTRPDPQFPQGSPLAMLRKGGTLVHACVEFQDVDGEWKWRHRSENCEFCLALAAVERLVEAAGPMAWLPWPLSADERQEWIVAQNRLREALAPFKEEM